MILNATRRQFFKNANLRVSHLKGVASEGRREVSKYMVGDSCLTVQNLKAPQNQVIVSLRGGFLV